MEYMIGRSSSNSMLNLGATDVAIQTIYDLGIEIEELTTG